MGAGKHHRKPAPTTSNLSPIQHWENHVATAASKPNRAIALPDLRVGLAGNVDLRNMGIIIAGFLGVLLLIPLTRSYPVTDDWTYSQSVSDLIHLAYKPHDWAQAVAIGHNAWGAIWAVLFGNTFTVLTIANMVMSIACLLTFYLLLRQLRVKPGPALLGVALLGFNPIYVYISYSFMTDVTFLFYILAACLLYIRGLEGHGEHWLWLGGVATALSYLTRQYGILVIIAALGFLWLSRRWTWRQAIAITVIPIVAVVGYAIWEHFQPTTLINIFMVAANKTAGKEPLLYLDSRILHIVWMLPSLGLSLAPLLRLHRRAIWAMLVFAFIVSYQFQSLRYTGSLFPRPETGNVVDTTGLLMFAYGANQVWNQSVWAVLGVIGGLIFSFFLVLWIRQIVSYLKAKPWRNPAAQDAAFVPYALAFMIAGVVLVATPFVFDRYWLAVLPMLMIPSLRRMSLVGVKPDESISSNNEKTAFSHNWRWVALLPIAAFSLLAMRDYKEHATVRWQAADSLVAGGAKVNQIRAGIEWDNWYNYKDSAQYIHETGDLTHIDYPPDAVIDPIYTVNDLPVKGYEQIGSLPYHSWLEGGATRQVLLLKQK